MADKVELEIADEHSARLWIVVADEYIAYGCLERVQCQDLQKMLHCR